MAGKAFGNLKTTGKPVTGGDDDDLLDTSTNLESTRINGGDGDDSILGSDAADRVNAGDGNDTVEGGLGDDILFGNDGEDTAVFSGSIVDYVWEWTKGNTLNVSGADGDDQLKQFEFLQFDDFTFALGGNNGPLALLRNAATTEENTNLTLMIDMYDFDGDEVSVVSVSSSRGSVSATEGLGASEMAAVGSSEGLEIAFDPLGDFDYLAVGQTTTETVTLVLEDSTGLQTTTTFDITVTGTNDAPTLAAGAAGAVEDGPSVTIDLAALGDDVDSDDNGASLSYTITGPAGEGSASISGTTLSFDPGSDFQDLAVGETRDVSIEVTATDAHGATAVNTMTVTVTGTNDAPTLEAGAVGAVEDGPSVTIDLAALGDDVDSDDNGASLSYTITGPAGEGSASISGTTLSFDPGSDFQDLAVGETRDVSIEVTATDAHGATAVNTMTVTVTGTNDAPTLEAGSVGAVEDGPSVTIDLAALGDDVDSDDNGASLSYTITGPAGEGSASISGTTLSFDPGSDFQDLAVGETRDVEIEVTATDAHGATAVNTMTVTVTGTNDGPVANDDEIGTGGNRILFVSDSGVGGAIATVLDGAGYDVDVVLDDFVGSWYTPGETAALTGDLSDYAAVFWSASGNGYGDHHGAAMFTNLQNYVSNGGSVFVTGYDSVASPSDPNLISFLGGTSSSDFGYPVTGASGANSLTTGVIDIQGVIPAGYYGDVDTIYVDPSVGTQIVVGSSYGGLGASWSLRGLGDGEIAYVSNGQYGTSGSHGSWTDSSAGAYGAYNAALLNFAYHASQGGGGVVEGGTISVDAADLLGNDTDVDASDVLSVISVSNDNGPSTVSLSGSTITYDTNGEFEGLAEGEEATDTFTYTISDGNGGTDSATVTVHIVGENDAPTLAAGLAGAVEDGPSVNIDLAALGDDVDSDDDGASLTYTITGPAGEGSASISGTTLSFDPGSDFQDLAQGETSDVTIQVTATDAHGATAVNDMVVTVTGTNDAPEVVAINAGSVSEDDAPVLIDLLAGQSDVDNGAVLSAQNISVTDDLGNPVAFTDNGDGTISIDPYQYDDLDTGESRTVTVSYDVSDGIAATANTATLVVDGVTDNSPPVANDDMLGRTEIFLNFDDLPTGQEVPTGYGGFDWYADTSSYALNNIYTYNYGNSYSGPNVAIPGFGPEHSFIERVDGGDFQFESAYFGVNQSYVSPITLNGYLDGVLVSSFTFSQPAGNGYQFVEPNLGTIDRLEIDSNSSGWWRMDDATFSTQGITVDEDTAITIDAADLLANDTDPDGDVLSISGVSGTSSLGATVTLNGDGSVTYDPTSSGALDDLMDGETAEDTFTYTVSDGNGGFDTATVTLVVDGVTATPATVEFTGVPVVVAPLGSVFYSEDGFDFAHTGNHVDSATELNWHDGGVNPGDNDIIITRGDGAFFNLSTMDILADNGLQIYDASNNLLFDASGTGVDVAVNITNVDYLRLETSGGSRIDNMDFEIL